VSAASINTSISVSIEIVWTCGRSRITQAIAADGHGPKSTSSAVAAAGGLRRDI
jgi:hypothetical protein